MALTQQERDWLDWLKQAKRKQITQSKAAEQMKVSERWVRKLLQRMKQEGDRVVVHKLRGKPSNRRLSQEMRTQIVKILSEPVYAGFGPTLAAEYLASKHQIQVGRETLRQLMSGAGLWRARRRKVDPIHTWRERRSRFGELVQWDTSTHDWLEGRGPQLKLIRMIDDATSRSLLRFAEHDSVEENLGLLERWLQKFGRMVSCYTDKASLFQTTEKRRRDHPGQQLDPRQMPPTQIGRALTELQIALIEAHSPQAKGRVERAFETDQDRLVKGLREAKVCTLERANAYLEKVYEPWWDANCAVVPAETGDAHRCLGKDHDLASILSRVETRQVHRDYTVHFHNRLYRIERDDIVTGLRGAQVRIEQRGEGRLAMSFRGKLVRFQECSRAVKTVPVQPVQKPPRKNNSTTQAQRKTWNRSFKQMKDIPLWQAAKARG